MRKGRKKRRLARWCGMPEDALSCGARATWMARTSVLVEGQRGMVEMTPERMRLRTDDGVLSVTGKKLTLHELSADAALICAQRIDTLTYDCAQIPEKGGNACT